MKLGLWFVIGFIAALAVPGLAIPRAQNQDADRNSAVFTTHDHENLEEWYREQHDYPPRGFRYRDRLPEKLRGRLVAHEVLPKELRKRIVPMPVEVTRLLQAPAPGCRYVALGGNVVLIEKKTWVVEDAAHLDLRP